MPDPYYIYRPMLDLIGHSEGTDFNSATGRGRGYNETLGYGAYSGGDRELVTMTLDQIDHLQSAMLAHPANRWNSSAIGRYQIVRTTMRAIRGKLKLSGRELFDPAMQDRMACFLLGGRGIDRWLAGRMSEDALIDELAKEWASLPTTKGKGHYGGQNAAVTVRSVRRALTQVEWRAAGQQTPSKGIGPSKTGNAAPAPAPGRKSGILAGILAALGLGAGAAYDPDRLAAWIIGALIVLAIAAAIFLVWRSRK